MNGFIGPDGETEEVDETTQYWTRSGDALVKFSPTNEGIYGFQSVRLPGSDRTVIMRTDFACRALRRGWYKYYLKFPNDKDLTALSREIMET